METHEDSITLPPVKVRVSLGSEDLTIKVSYLPGLVCQCHCVNAVFIPAIFLYFFLNI